MHRHVPSGVHDVQARAYGATSFAAATLSGIFNLCYVDVFNHVYGLDERWFHAGQIIFAIWNAVNDPLFGFLNDRTTGLRMQAISRGGKAWALAFLIPWFTLYSVMPVGEDAGEVTAHYQTLVGVHFILSICLFDTFLTYVLIVHCALLADLTTSTAEREKLNMWRQIGSIVGTVPVFGGFMLYNRDNLTMFRVYCCIIAAISWRAFQYTASVVTVPSSHHGAGAKGSDTKGGLYQRTSTSEEDPFSQLQQLDDAQQTKKSLGHAQGKLLHLDTRNTIVGFLANSPLLAKWAGELKSMWRFMKQVFRMKNFCLFLVLNFCQQFNTYFNLNFFTVFEEMIFKDSDVFSSWRFVMSFSALVLPPLCVLGLSNWSSKYHAIQGVNIVKLVLSGLVFLFGAGSPSVIGLYLVTCNILNGAGFGFYDLVVADLIDEDAVVHRRDRPLATMMHGTQSLIVKPAQSFAPMFGVFMLNRITKDADSPLTSEEDSYSLFKLITLVPAACAVLQIVAWSRYTLRGDYLASIKRRRIIAEERSEFLVY